MRLTDTHCHLNLTDAFPDPGAALARAKENNVDRVLLVGMDTETSRRAVELAKEHECVYAVVGWHPNYAANYTSSGLKEIESLAQEPEAVAIGEIGLDYHWDYASPEQQRLCTTDQVELAADLGLPVVFHCRDAYADLLDWLEALQNPPVRMALHCFSGDERDALRARALGCWFGVDGPITYKKADDLRRIVSQMPTDRILLETDSPYMAPHPYRGRPNEPAMLPLINDGLASLLKMSPEQSADITTANADRFFALPPANFTPR
ncbi:MAG: TatD family hydrolase [Armatimonadetes bacterium]|nr:TatD family hydrolase [Armatimonadota bacterium]